MNNNRAGFLSANAPILKGLTQGKRYSLAELRGLLKPGAISAIDWLSAIKASPGSTDMELASEMGSSPQVAGQTLRALADGGAIERKPLEAKDSDVGRKEIQNFLL